VFMLIAGINFTLHFQLLRGKFQPLFKNLEFQVFMAFIILASLFISLDLYQSLGVYDAIRHALFQVVSVITTTGYASQNFELWPPLSQTVIFFLMFVGAMAGSTGGGIKVIRIILVFKQGLIQIKKLIHPALVSHVKIGGKVINDVVLKAVYGFLILYVGIYVISVLIISSFGIDLVTSLTAAITCLGNVGPGFGAIGALDNFAHFPATVKILLSLLMMMGRLELYTVLVLVVPQFWKN
jgi:trk system potassium uptake protein